MLGTCVSFDVRANNSCLRTVCQLSADMHKAHDDAIVKMVGTQSWRHTNPVSLCSLRSKVLKTIRIATKNAETTTMCRFAAGPTGIRDAGGGK